MPYVIKRAKYFKREKALCALSYQLANQKINFLKYYA